MTQTPVPQQDGNKAANSNNNRLRMNVQMGVILAVVLALVAGFAIAAQDKYSAKVPGGLAMSEFRGYEDWQAISIRPERKSGRDDSWQSSDDRRLPRRHSCKRQTRPGRSQDGKYPLDPESGSVIQGRDGT